MRHLCLGEIHEARPLFSNCNEARCQIQSSHLIFEGSLEVKLPTIWTDGKAEVGRVRKEKKRSNKIREEKE